MLRDFISEETCRDNPDVLFVFGDNLIGKGRGGQAIIRYEPNAVGIPTKRLPSLRDDAFFSDRVDEEKALVDALRALYKRAKDENKKICWPSSGLGTGLAQMQQRSPKLFKLMNNIIAEHFSDPYSSLSKE